MVLLLKHSRKETHTKHSAPSNVLKNGVDTGLIFIVSHQVSAKAAAQTASTFLGTRVGTFGQSGQNQTVHLMMAQYLTGFSLTGLKTGGYIMIIQSSHLPTCKTGPKAII